MPRAKAPFERFQTSYTIDQDTDCWNWEGYTDGDRYGMIKVFGSFVLAHRYSYELYNGPIPDGMEILHSCDNKQCVNPKHLAVGTHQENMAQAAQRGRMRSGANHPFFGKPSQRRGINSHQSNPVLVHGKPYGGQNEAETSLGLAHGSVRYWLQTGSTKAKWISREQFLAMTMQQRRIL